MSKTMNESESEYESDDEEERYYAEMDSITLRQKRAIEKEDWTDETEEVRTFEIANFDFKWELSWKEQQKLKKAIEEDESVEMTIFILKEDTEENLPIGWCVMYFNFPSIIDRVIRMTYSGSSAVALWCCYNIPDDEECGV
jgi:hypothetical protein